MIKNLVFDYGKVLVDYGYDHVTGCDFDNEADRNEFMSLVRSPEFLAECDLELIPFEQIMLREQKAHPRIARQLKVFYDHYLDFMLGEIPGMNQALRSFKAQGYKLYGLTNWCSVVYNVIGTYEIFSLLDGTTISCEEHMRKPDLCFYQRFLDKFGLKASECVFTDDKIENVEGAHKAGLFAILFENTEQYLRDLAVILDAENSK